MNILYNEFLNKKKQTIYLTNNTMFTFTWIIAPLATPRSNNISKA